MKHEQVLVLDFGAQYAQLIARRVRECGVYAEIVAHDISAAELRARRPRGLIFSGGPASVLAPGAPRPDPQVFQLGIPILGICYGIQLMAHMLGGEVARAHGREYGPAQLEVLDPDVLFSDLPRKMTVWMSHGDRVVRLPEGFAAIARTEAVDIVAAANLEKKLFGVQFHPEVTHTEHGKKIIANFLFRACRCSGDWKMEDFIQTTVADIRRTVGEGRVLCGISGGVDSAVTAVLCHRAIGERLDCVMVDNGLLRAGEVEEVRAALAALGVRLHVVDAAQRFLSALAGVTDPEQKRRIIGHTFIDVFRAEAERLGKPEFLAQGTLYPDVIESRSPRGGPSATIKSHHNVGGLPEDMEFKLVEPLRSLFKDEVREVGRLLGLPENIVRRQPFPGPGLAVRVVGEVTEQRLNTLRAADRIVREEVERAELGFDVWQAFAVLLPVRSVGVMGDERTYENAVVVRVVTSEDGMTADWARLPADLRARVSARIVNEVKGACRVVYDITSKPPGTIEWE